jgi:hypothetical protein
MQGKLQSGHDRALKKAKSIWLHRQPFGCGSQLSEYA